jgi:hypothetical protein
LHGNPRQLFHCDVVEESDFPRGRHIGVHTIHTLVR